MCAVLIPVRGNIANTHVALILVVIVVGVAALGRRAAGYLAALFAGFWFDFFFTEPFQRLSVYDRTDIETLVLLLAVGVAVTELSMWGRRQQALASREAGYLAGIHAAASARGGSSPSALIRQVADQLVATLELRDCRFQYGVAGVGRPARLGRDGGVTWHGDRWDVDHQGLPVGTEIELLVQNGGRLHGRYLMTVEASRPVTLDQRRVAVTLADQLGSALG